MIELKRGTQIIFVPRHANGDINHSDCERGFVTSIHYRENTEVTSVFCRYWLRQDDELRTKGNSELTRINALVICDTVPHSRVETALRQYCGASK